MNNFPNKNNNNNNNNNTIQSQTRTHGNNSLSGFNNNTSRDKPMSNKICNWCGRYGHDAKECKSKEARERFLNQQKERGNKAIEEDCIEETDGDYQSHNENVAEVGFIATESIVSKGGDFSLCRRRRKLSLLHRQYHDWRLRYVAPVISEIPWKICLI